MPTSDPIGPLSPAAGLAPGRSSAAGAPSPADGTQDPPQPSRGFLSSLRKAQRSGADSSARPAEGHHAGVARDGAPEADAQPPAAPQAVESSAPAPPPDAAAPDVAAAAFAVPTVQALQIASEAAVVTEIANALPVTSDRLAPVELPVQLEATAAPVAQDAVPMAVKGASTIPSALQEWLSSKPAWNVKTAASNSAVDDRSDVKAPVESSPIDASTIPPGLQVALAAVVAVQAAAQPVLAAKASTAVADVQSPVSQLPVVSSTINSPVKAIAGTELQPALQGDGPAPFAPIALTAGGNPRTAPAVPSTTPVAAAPAATVMPQVNGAEDDAMPVAAEQEPVTAPVTTSLAAVVPVAVQNSGGTTPGMNVVDSAAPAVKAAGSIAASADSAAPAARVSDARSAEPEADLKATASPLTDAAADAPSATSTSAVVAASPSDEPARPGAAADARVAVAERVVVDAGGGDSSVSSAGGRNDLGPLVTDRAVTAAPLALSASVVQVSPHDSQGLVEHVTQLVLESHSSGQQLSLQITPPDLGTVRIEVHSHGGVLTARLEADSPAARQLLTDHLPQLREALQQQGANLDRIDVYQSDRSMQGEGMADSSWQSSQQDRQPDAAPLLYDDEEATEPEGVEARGSLALGELNIRV